ncbi:hypothetical protein L484_023391 [Morus notabilis]|uniref:R13L1/DRL21-like LRR repeat region domain-containing protein n=1 Tax=Morus notabilis TaxID=981085 RepID=W9SDJ0_9ROSA|nr:hypothetical protein L484_023391 [Morus notabilis]
MKLDIREYADLNIPDWLGDSLFSKLISVQLSGNEYCMFLPPLRKSPFLRELVIESFYGVRDAIMSWPAQLDPFSLGPSRPSPLFW